MTSTPVRHAKQQIKKRQVEKGQVGKGLVGEGRTGRNQVYTDYFPPIENHVVNSAPLVICIDNNSKDSKMMGDILHKAGFRFHKIHASTRVLPKLIEYKPQLIFLDLIMPMANSYEICSQVRRVSLFKDIPIVIVTRDDTLADRVRAKVVGASSFLSKPIQRSKVLKVVHKLLNEAPADTNPTEAVASVVTSLTKAQIARTAQTLQQRQMLLQRRHKISNAK